MQHVPAPPTPVLAALGAIQLARALRTFALSGPSPLPKSVRSLPIDLSDILATPRLFTTPTLEMLEVLADHLDRLVVSGTTIAQDVQDGWDEEGRAVPIVNEYEVLTDDARRFKALASDLRRLAELVLASIDLLEAERIVTRLGEPALRLPRGTRRGLGA